MEQISNYKDLEKKNTNSSEQITILAAKVDELSRIVGELAQPAEVINQEITNEINQLSPPFASEVFAKFSKKVEPFFEKQVNALERSTYGLSKIMESWSRLTPKAICIGVLASVLIGITSCFLIYWLVLPARLTPEQVKFIAYGKALEKNHHHLKKEDLQIVIKDINWASIPKA